MNARAVADGIGRLVLGSNLDILDVPYRLVGTIHYTIDGRGDEVDCTWDMYVLLGPDGLRYVVADFGEFDDDVPRSTFSLWTLVRQELFGTDLSLSARMGAVRHTYNGVVYERTDMGVANYVATGNVGIPLDGYVTIFTYDGPASSNTVLAAEQFAGEHWKVYTGSSLQPTDFVLPAA